MQMRFKLISITAFNTTRFAVYLQKTLYFLVFHRNIGLKTSKHEFTDKSHQNKQGFEGKKAKREGIPRVWRVSESMCGRHRLFGELHAKILYTVFLPRFLLLILQNPSKWYALLVFGQNSWIQAFILRKNRNKILASFLSFQKILEWSW